jgi:peptidoglycan/LPS O-acetylase OafA/YrhL
MQYFSVGIMVCDIWLARWRTLSRSGLWDLVGIISIILFFSLNLSAFHAAAKVMNPWLFGVFAASALRGKALGSSLSWGVVPILGGMCYSVYLLHARVVSVLLHVVFSQVPLSSNFTIDFALLSLAVVPITFASCAVFYLLIERPCMDPAWPSALMRKIKGKTSE